MYLAPNWKVQTYIVVNFGQTKILNKIIFWFSSFLVPLSCLVFLTCILYFFRHTRYIILHFLYKIAVLVHLGINYYEFSSYFLRSPSFRHLFKALLNVSSIILNVGLSLGDFSKHALIM